MDRIRLLFDRRSSDRSGVSGLRSTAGSRRFGGGRRGVDFLGRRRRFADPVDGAPGRRSVGGSRRRSVL